MNNNVIRIVVAGAGFAIMIAGRPAVNAADESLARGQYLVNGAGQCGDCHGSDLRGSALGFLRPGVPGVAYSAPPIAGLAQLSTAQATHFLETGMLPNGKRARHPMPSYRFSAQDASAIVAYLKSQR